MIHHVFANRSNIGDWLSARGIQSLLAPCEVVEHLCDAPFVPETLSALEAVTDEDLIVIGGGGLFMDYFVPFWEGFRPIAGRVPFVIWGVGYCDVKREPSRPQTSMLEEIVRMSRLCLVRDDLTRSYLRRCDLDDPLPCPSMTVVPCPAPAGFGLLYADAYDNIGATVYEYVVDSLEKYAAATGRNYRQTANIIQQGSESQLQQVLNLYLSADLVVASRLHGCILGLAMGRKVLAISGDHKIESFMQAAGLDEWVLGLDEIGLLEKRLETLPHQPGVGGFVGSVRARNRLVAAQIKSMIDEPVVHRVDRNL